MSKYIMRLDDACEKWNKDNWIRMEMLLDQYGIKPLVGIIPHCEDPMMEAYSLDTEFWKRVKSWIEKGWTIALHGYNHVYSTESGGINPVNNRSEFADEPLEIQRDKVSKGIATLNRHGINPKVFFAPSHTFDLNTLKALELESSIRIISDTIADKPYSKFGFTFVPQQSGNVRELPFSIITFCYHPNGMSDNDFYVLEKFINVHEKAFIKFPEEEIYRNESFYDKVLKIVYFLRRIHK